MYVFNTIQVSMMFEGNANDFNDSLKFRLYLSLQFVFFGHKYKLQFCIYS